MAETKTERLFQLWGWIENREEVPYPYKIAKNGSNQPNSTKWETLAEGTEEQMLAYWKLIDPVSWAKEMEER